MRFRKISEIKIDDNKTWGKDNIFISFDIDWAHDDIISYTLDLVESANLAATWFVTHDTPMLQRLRSNSKFELGIHPNFNSLLDGDLQYGSCAERIVDKMLEIVPEAKSIRSHSLVQSSRLSHIFNKKGLTHESNMMIPLYSGIELKPFIHGSGITIVPYCYGDYLAFSMPPNLQKTGNNVLHTKNTLGLCVIDFHPIHIFLNTEDASRYNDTRKLHNTPNVLGEYQYEGVGARTELEKIMRL